MANITTLALGGSTGPVGATGPSPTVWTHEINLADAAATVTTGGLIRVVNCPADSVFTLDRVEIVTAVSLDSGASGRIDVGDSADDDEFVSNHTTFTAGTDATLLKTTGSTVGAYTSADHISLKVTGDKLAGGTANATGIIRFAGTCYSVARNAKAVFTA